MARQWHIAIAVVDILAAAALVVPIAASAAKNVHTATLNGSAKFPAATGKAKFSVDDEFVS